MLHRESWSLQIMSYKMVKPNAEDGGVLLGLSGVQLMKVGSCFATALKLGDPNPSIKQENQILRVTILVCALWGQFLHVLYMS